MSEQQFQSNELQLTTDDLCLLIGEKEVRLYQERRKQQNLFATFGDAVEKKAKERTAQVEKDTAKISANVKRLQDRIAERDTRIVELEHELKNLRQKASQAIARAETAEKELSRRDKISAAKRGKKK